MVKLIFLLVVLAKGYYNWCRRGYKNRKFSVCIIAVEPADSTVHSGGTAGFHKIQGIGAGFVPDVFNTDIIDEIVNVKHTDAGDLPIRLARIWDIPAGVSSGVALYAIFKVAGRGSSAEKTIVVIFPDTGERYLASWIFD